MRALVAHPGPSFSVADVYKGWLRGLRECGVEVAEFNLDDRLSFYSNAHLERDGEMVYAFDNQAAIRMAAKGLEAACYEWWPDLVLIVSGFFVQPYMLDVMRDRGHSVVLLHTESPYEDDRQSVLAQHAHLNLLNDPTNLAMFPAGTRYMPHAYDPRIHRPRNPVERCRSDFAFVGTAFPSRVEFFDQVDFGDADVLLAGNWRSLTDTSPLRRFVPHDLDECCPNDETALIYASTKASVNLYRKEASLNAHGWAVGPREIELAATGTFFLRESRGEGDDLFPMLPTFDSPGDFSEKLAWWLAHDDERSTAARKAREAVTGRTFAHNAAELLRLLGN